VIGYHNWKEVRYLTSARNFIKEGFFKYGFFVPAYDYPGLHSDPSGAHSDFFPFSSIFAALSMQVFGMELWAARLPGILLSMGSVIFIYLLMKQIFKREDIALISAFLAAINPLFIFFSHNVQQMTPGLFFMMGAYYFYSKWIDDDKAIHIILTSLLMMFSIVSKYTYVITLIPLLFIFPFERLREIKKNLFSYIISILVMLPLPAWYFYSKEIAMKYSGTVMGGEIDKVVMNIDLLSQSSFWKTMEAYAADNYTLLGVLFAFLGIMTLIITFDRKSMGKRFLAGYVLTSIFGFVFLSGRLSGHAYHQFPIAPCIIILIAYFIVTVGDFLKRINIEGKNIGYVNIIGMIIVVLLIVPTTQNSTERLFDTQFYGLDVAGEYIKEHKTPNERVIHSSHQAYGLLWHGDIKGTRGIPKTVEDIKFAEEKLNASWVFTYNFCYPQGQVCFEVYSKPYEDSWSYIKNHYLLKQIAFVRSSKGNIPVYYLLKKGGTFDENRLNEMITGKPIKYKDYELTKGIVRMYYVNIEE